MWKINLHHWEQIPGSSLRSTNTDSIEKLLRLGWVWVDSWPYLLVMWHSHGQRPWFFIGNDLRMGICFVDNVELRVQSWETLHRAARGGWDPGMLHINRNGWVFYSFPLAYLDLWSIHRWFPQPMFSIKDLNRLARKGFFRYYTEEFDWLEAQRICDRIDTLLARFDMGGSWNGGSPKSSIYRILKMDFPWNKPSILAVPPFMETPIWSPDDGGMNLGVILKIVIDHQEQLVPPS